MTSYAKQNAIKALDAALMALPVDNPERPKLRDRIPIAEHRLAARCRKFLTLSPVFQRANPLPVDQWPVPSYAEWLRRAMAPRPLAAEPVLVPCDNDLTDVASYIREFCSLNGLKP